MKSYQEALKNLNQALELNPADSRTLAKRGEIYRLLARYDEALVDFNEAVNLAPDYAWVLAHKGETYRQVRQYQNALTDLNQAIQLRPDYAWAIAHRGATYCQLRDFEAALLDLNRAVDLQPDYAWAFIYRTQVDVAIKDYDQALADYDRAIILDPTILPHWQGERGLLLNYLGRYAETIAGCEAVLQEKREDHVAWYSLTVARARWCGVAAAQGDIEQTGILLHLKTDDETYGLVFYRLGGLAALTGQKEQALNYLQEAIRLHHEPAELARHDPAWLDLRTNPRFQLLIAQSAEMSLRPVG